ncbi:Positive regulator of sigma(E)%2C RseC/MucC [uncultured Clostridium sp.]|uniref:SoxR reducing system RseC family protein n=1 Tax=Paeniclostridium hominis TaxID=2764329 RepID=UPI000822A02A|nr:SoxR reducing system RseC family protein [Paeniclostridium hominis]SCI92575.1 Positive regulator of sigma(E)%2C RseC/MucC [uncultured Clostridium sp.]SCJ04705.1 Positive regulator of sigma(E)%2C RseC/MucC [uncultured Clostridium sp.]
MKKIGFVIDSNENSASIKLNESKKIITANNDIDAKIGQEVCVEFKKIKAIKLIYINIIQPIILAIIGILIGDFVSINLNQRTLIYKLVFGCIFFTISIIYKDYHKEKSKISGDNNYNIVKIISK